MKRLHAILMTLLLPAIIYHGYARWMLLTPQTGNLTWETVYHIRANNIWLSVLFACLVALAITGDKK